MPTKTRKQTKGTRVPSFSDETIRTILAKVFAGAHPGTNMFRMIHTINTGLVLMGIRKGAIINVDKSVCTLLETNGVYVTKIKGDTFISLRKPTIDSTTTDTELGKALGYLTPTEIKEDDPTKRFMDIKVVFRRKSGKPIETYLLSQVVIGKTEAQMKRYLQPFIKGIQSMPLPEEFTILECTPMIQ